MANEPSLNEILNAGASASPELGTPATVIDSSQLIKTLNDNARFKAENDWKKYNVFLGNLKEAYKDLGDISGLEVATQDRDALKQQTSDIFKEIADNPRAFFGGQKMGEIQAKIAGLRSAATESKLNRVYDFAHREYMNRNPELNTPENQKTINEYWKQPLGKRNPYMLNMPPIFDAQELMKGILASPTVQQKFAHSSLTDASGQPGNEFIREMEGTQYNRENFLKAWMGSLAMAKDKYGHSIRGAVEQQFNQLSDQQKKQFGSVDNYFKALGEIAFGSDKDIQQITKDEIKGNPNLYKAEELKLKQEGVKQRWAMYGLAAQKLKDAEETDLFGADAVIDDALSKISKGTLVQEVDRNGNMKDYFEIADPDLLKQYSTLDKDGKTNLSPDVIRYDKDKDQLNLVYFKRKKSVSGPGEIQINKNGSRTIERAIPIDSRTWLKNTTNTMFPNKDKGKVNKLIDDVLEKNKGGLYEILQKKEGNQGEQGQKQQSNQKKSYKLGNKTFTYDKIQKAAQQSGMTVDEYIKQAGLQ